MRTTPPEAGRLLRYGIALLTVLLAFVATFGTWPLLKPTPWALFFVAVIAAAWLGGHGPSLVATVLSAVVGQYFFFEPIGSFSFGPEGPIPTLVFLGVSLFIGLLASTRRKAEAFERAERRRFQATVSSIGDAVIATDATGRVTFMNVVAEELTGWELAAARGERLVDVFVIVNETTRLTVPNPVEKVLETGSIQGLANHTILIARDGTERPIDDSAAPIRNDRGEMTGVVLVFHDITEKHKVAKELAESEEFNRRIISSSVDCLKVVDLEGRLVSMNEFGCRLMEIDDFSPCVNQEWIGFWPEETRGIAGSALDEAKAGRIASFQGVCPTAKGTAKWWDVTISPVFDGGGKPQRLLVVSRDITGRMLAEAEMLRLREEEREADKRAERILESITDAFFALDHNWRFTYVNSQAERVLDRRPGDLLGKILWDEFPGIPGSEFESAYLKAVAERVAVSFTSYYPDHDRWYEVHAYPAADGLSVYFRDVTARKRTDEALRVSEEQLRLTLESTELGSWHFDPASAGLVVDARFRAIFGITDEHIGYDEAVSVIHPQDQSRVRAAVDAATRSEDPEPYAVEYRVTHSDGSIRWVFAKGKANHESDGGRLLSFNGTVNDITDRKTAEQNLKASEERYRTLFDSMDEGFCVIDVLFDEADRPIDYLFVEVNPAFEKHTGLRNVAGKTVLEAVPGHDTLWIDLYGKVALTGESAKLIHEVKVLARWFEVSAFRHGDGAGRRVAVLFNDITDRVRAENDREHLLREVQTERGRLADVIQRSPSFMTILKGPDLIFELVNERYSQLVGNRQVIGMKLRDALPEVAGQGYFEMLDGVYRSGEPVIGKDSRVMLAGLPGEPIRERFLDFVFQPIRDPDGVVSGVLVHGIDLTERKHAEQEARSKDERVKLLVENIKDYAVIISDLEGRVAEWQGGAERITGYSPAEAVGREVGLIFTPEDRAEGAPTRELAKAAASGRAEDKRWHLRKDRSRFFADGVTTALYDDGGKLRGFGKVFKDVTGEKQAEEATVHRASQLQRLAEIATRINSAHDVHSVLGVVTEEARRLLGAHQAATNMNLNPGHTQPVNVVSTSAEYTNGAATPEIEGMLFYEAVGSNNEAIRLTRSDLDAHPRWQSSGKLGEYAATVNGWLAAPLMGRNGRSMGLLHLSDKKDGDFTADDEAILVQLSQLAAIAIENARLYEELRSNDERKDEFLAMLAHELRNPLAAIGNAVRLTSMSDAKQHVDWSNEVITRQMQHLSRLIDDLMDVSRITRGKIALRRDVTEATPILESAAATVRTLVDERKHTLELDIDRGNVWVDVDPTRLEQVIVNLLNNAAKYSENAGHIRLTAGVEKDEVVIAVRDKGVGIPPEKLPEMFEMFAQGDRSLARSEGGLGIGLTVVKKLVEMHGGSIMARSEGHGKGSEFVIRLPAAKKPSSERQVVRSPAEREHRKVRILVVDDNVDTARGMARLMKLIGHEVATAHDGHEALEVAREFHPEFVMLDIGLPGMSGYEVAAKLRQESCCEDSMIVAVSGYGQDEDRRRSKEAGFDHHLTKPVDHDDLMGLLTDGKKAEVRRKD